MDLIMKPFRKVKESGGNLEQRVLDVIRPGELVEVAQGEGQPSKFLYKDVAGHLHWMSFPLLNTVRN